MLQDLLPDPREGIADRLHRLTEPPGLLRRQLVVGLVQLARDEIGPLGVLALQRARLLDDVVVRGGGVVELGGRLVQRTLGGTQTRRRGIGLRLAGVLLAGQLEVGGPARLVTMLLRLGDLGLLLPGRVVVLLRQVAMRCQVTVPGPQPVGRLPQGPPGVPHVLLEVTVEGVPEGTRRIALPGGAGREQPLDLAMAVVQRLRR